MTNVVADLSSMYFCFRVTFNQGQYVQNVHLISLVLQSPLEIHRLRWSYLVNPDNTHRTTSLCHVFEKFSSKLVFILLQNTNKLIIHNPVSKPTAYIQNFRSFFGSAVVSGICKGIQWIQVMNFFCALLEIFQQFKSTNTPRICRCCWVFFTHTQIILQFHIKMVSWHVIENIRNHLKAQITDTGIHSKSNVPSYIRFWLVQIVYVSGVIFNILLSCTSSIQ